MRRKPVNKPYTCNDYRSEMILLSLERQMNKPDLTETEKRKIAAEIKRVKAEMDME